MRYRHFIYYFWRRVKVAGSLRDDFATQHYYIDAGYCLDRVEHG